MSPADDPDLARALPVLAAVREAAPLVHCLTATVSMQLVADGLLAAGLDPATVTLTTLSETSAAALRERGLDAAATEALRGAR